MQQPLYFTDAFQDETFTEEQAAEALAEQLLAELPDFPTMYDLPSEYVGEPGLPDEFHGLQSHLLSLTLKLSGYQSSETFTANDLNLYYDLAHPLWYKRPDWFLAAGVSRLYEGKVSRDSYVVWQEKVNPTIVVELLSPGTEGDDLGRFAIANKKRSSTLKQHQKTPQKARKGNSPHPPSKFEVYEEILKVPYYIVFNKRGNQLRYFRQTQGRYQEQSVAASNPRLWIPELDLGLALWQGNFRGITQSWLRWCDENGILIPTEAEAARKEAQLAQAKAQLAQTEAQLAQQQRAQAEAQVQQTVRNLLALAMPIEQVAQVTGLSVEAIETMTI
jgi:Uma2 family endonuclease